MSPFRRCGVVQSYREALNALGLAARMNLDGPVLHAADLLVSPVLTRDREAMADLVRSALAPSGRPVAAPSRCWRP